MMITSQKLLSLAFYILYLDKDYNCADASFVSYLNAESSSRIFELQSYSYTSDSNNMLHLNNIT